MKVHSPLKSRTPQSGKKEVMRLRPHDEQVQAGCGHISPRRHSFLQWKESGDAVQCTIEALKENEAPLFCPTCANNLKTQLTITDGFIDSPVSDERSEVEAADDRGQLKLVT